MTKLIYNPKREKKMKELEKIVYKGVKAFNSDTSKKVEVYYVSEFNDYGANFHF